MNPRIQQLLEELAQRIAAQTPLSEHEVRDELGLEPARPPNYDSSPPDRRSRSSSASGDASRLGNRLSTAGSLIAKHAAV